MRLLIKINLYMLLLLVVSCGNYPAEITHALDRAEGFMDEHPDSALAILDSIGADTLVLAGMSRADHARYALLLTQARHKNYIDETSDSLITVAVDYYDRHASSEPMRLMLARYYQGVVRSNAHNYASAILSLMKAESLAESLDRPLWLGRSQLAISDIYNDIHSPADEVRYAEKACGTYRQSKDSFNLRYAEESLITSLNNAHRYDDALRLGERMYKEAVTDRDTIFMGQLLESIGFSRQHLNLHHEAIDAFRKFQELTPQKMKSKHYYYLSTALWNAGRHAESKALIDSIRLMFGSKGNVHPGILHDLGMIDEAYNQQKADFSEANDFVRSILSQNVSATVAQYYDEEIAVKEARLRQNRIIIICIAIIVVLIVASLAYRLSVYKREKKRKEDEIMELARELSSLNLELSSTTQELVLAQDEIKSTLNRLETLSNESSRQLYDRNRMESDRLSALSVLCECYNSFNLGDTAKSQTTEDVLKFIDKIASDPNLNSDLEAKVNREYDNLMIKFRQQMPDLNDKYYNIFVWGVLRISTSTIYHLWKMNRNSFYSSRRRLREKIIVANPLDASKFLSFLN